MDNHSESIVVEHHEHGLSLGKYILGFALSVGLTLFAYMLATHQAYSKDIIIGALAVLAVVQFIVQMVFFLHIGAERKPRWKLAVMFLMLGVVLILVVGSLWIMNNLNYRMMDSPEQMNEYIHSQDSL